MDKKQINHSKSVHKTVNSFSFNSSNVTGGKDIKLLTELKCVYTNADSFMNKFDEYRTRFINDESDPHIIMITEGCRKIVDTVHLKQNLTSMTYFQRNFLYKILEVY